MRNEPYGSRRVIGSKEALPILGLDWEYWTVASFIHIMSPLKNFVEAFYVIFAVKRNLFTATYKYRPIIPKSMRDKKEKLWKLYMYLFLMSMVIAVDRLRITSSTRLRLFFSVSHNYPCCYTLIIFCYLGLHYKDWWRLKLKYNYY